MKKILIQNAFVLPMEGEALPRGFVLTGEDGRIAQLGPMSGCPEGADEVYDAAGGYVLPGLIDAHTHLGLYEDSLGFEGADGNEDTDPATPHLRAIDAVNPMERAFAEAREAGVTCCLVSPGSANPIGGEIAAIKTLGRRVDDMIVAAPVGIKFALGENPKCVYHEKDESPVTRMATAAILRENLRKAQEYDERKQRALDDPDEDAPDSEIKYEALLLLLHGEIAAHIHAHRADDIFTGLRICREFGLRPVIVHGTEGHLVADLLAQDDVPVLSGPFLTDRSKPELRQLTEAAPGLLRKAGVRTAITTDHPETPVKYLRHCAAVAAEHGMDETEALRAITLYPAQIVGIDSRVGSLVPGKDADLVVLSGHPFAFQSRVKLVLCNGQTAYRADE